MRRRTVVYEYEASRDLHRIFDWIAEFASPVAATRIVSDLEDFISRLDLAAERGTPRDDLRKGIRLIGRDRATIAMIVDEDEVYIMRIFYGGENWEMVLRNED